jgi:hypothetical protein
MKRMATYHFVLLRRLQSILKSEDDGEKKSIQTQQLEGHVHTSHLPLSEPSHQTKILIKADK